MIDDCSMIEEEVKEYKSTEIKRGMRGDLESRMSNRESQTVRS